MSRRWRLLLPLAVVVMPDAAWALKPGRHREIAERACADVGLPDAFCRRAGKQVFETDFTEWDTMPAHAQREVGQDRCSAADAAIARVEQLAREVVDQAHAGEHEKASIALGRALHTIQDECAHQGMTNQEHAFFSLTETCTGETVSPDTKPASLACAESRTREVMGHVAAALTTVRWDGTGWICFDGERDRCADASLPTPGMACDFLRQHDDWNGVDTTWNGSIVGPALVDGFAAGLAGTAPASRSLCGGDPNAIDPRAPHADMPDRTAGCNLADLACLGKVDEGGPDVFEDESAGCQAGRDSRHAALAVALLLGVCLRRRR